MKLKKLAALILVCALTLGLAAPALAADVDDEALKAVTLKVKTVLDLDTDIYTDFNGWSREDDLTGRRWTLNWSGDGAYLSITCDDEGKVYSYNRSETSVDTTYPVARGRFSIPSLPEGDAAAALVTAQSFVDKVLDKELESVTLVDNTYNSLNRTSFRFSGVIRLYGVDSPISCSVSVRASDNQVTSFRRGDEYSGYLGAIPTPETDVTEEQVRRDMKVAVTMEPWYVLQPDGKTARVRYLPVWGDEYYVDGKTGELVNLTELRRSLWSADRGGSNTNGLYFDSAASMEAPEAALDESKATLSQVELDGAAKLAGALDKEELDKLVQAAWPQLGLSKYTLSAAYYSVIERKLDGESSEYDITCRLTYGMKLTDSTARKYVTVDAKTGELQSFYASRRTDDNYPNAVTKEKAQAAAEDFLKVFAGDRVDTLALLDSAEPGKWSALYTLTFAQKENGYFYRSNSYTVTVDAVDGSISGVYFSYDDEVELVKPETVVTEEAARAAFIGALDVKYGYLEVPCDINLAGPEVIAFLKDAVDFHSYIITLRPGFGLQQPAGYVSGVDAETGAVIRQDVPEAERPWVTYDDVAGTWIATAANALAEYEIGFPGGSLRAGEALTQLDMLVLMASINGYHFDPAASDKDALDYFYDHCYYLGLVTPETRDPDKEVARGELVKLILDTAGYQKVATLPGIFRTDFSDAESIPMADRGYAALAQGLGLVKGGSDGAYAGSRTATRGEAVAMLYQYMK